MVKFQLKEEHRPDTWLQDSARNCVATAKSKGSGTYNQAYLQEETCSSRWQVLHRGPVATTLPLAESTG